MPDPKTIKLLVTIPDPGDACSEGNTWHNQVNKCRFWGFGAWGCLLGHRPIWSSNREQWVRPPSCKDSEVKP